MTAVTSVHTGVPWYFQKWFIILALFFAGPVGVWLLWRSPVTRLSGRIIWTTLVLWSMWVVFGNGLPLFTVPAPSTPSASYSAAATWAPTHTWTGSGIKTTESFTTTSREWRVRWSATAGDSGGVFTIFVLNEQGAPLAVPVNQQVGGSDVSYVRVPPGRYNLTVNSIGMNWRVEVEQNR